MQNCFLYYYYNYRMPVSTKEAINPDTGKLKPGYRYEKKGVIVKAGKAGESGKSGAGKSGAGKSGAGKSGLESQGLEITKNKAADMDL